MTAMEGSAESHSSGISSGESKSNQARQRKAPKPPVYSPGKPILQRLENSKPAPLDMGTISSGFQGTGLTQSPNLIDSSKPPPSNYAYAFQGDSAASDSDTDLACAAFIAASILTLLTCFLDMEIVITRVVELLVPESMQTQTLAWARLANLEVALWTSCSVVQACLVWSIFAALYGTLGLAIGLLPGGSAGFAVAATRFRKHKWAAGTVLHSVHPAAAGAATVVLVGGGLLGAHYLDRRRRRTPARAGESLNRFGWACSPEALMSLRISPMTRLPGAKTPSPTPLSRLG